MSIIKYLKETLKYALRSYPFIKKYVKEIEGMYAMSPLELKKRKEQKFIDIFRKAYDKSSFYHQLYCDAGIKKEDIKSIDDIKKLPIITKEDVKQYADDMVVCPRWKLLKNHTSGTTGTPLMVYEDWPSIWREQAYLYCFRKRCGYTFGQPIVSLRGNLGKTDSYLKVHLSNTLYLSSYNINEKTTALYHQKIQAHNPVAIEGYPSSLFRLASLFRDKGIELNIPVTFTSSETLLDNQRFLIEKQFHTQIYDHYGTTERTISLNESLDHSGYYEDPGYSHNEYLENGEITTSLINNSFPLIRYQGNDIIEMCDYNDSGVLIKTIHGREEDYIVCKDGSHVMRLGFLFKKASNVKAAQLIQQETGVVHILIVPETGYSEIDSTNIVNEFIKRVGRGNLDIHILKTSMENLIYSKSGKFKFILKSSNTIFDNNQTKEYKPIYP